MAGKFAKWTFSGNTLSLGDKATPIKISLNLTEVYPGFDQRPEYERFALVYAVKQMVGDGNSTVAGPPKVEAMLQDLAVPYLQAKTFAGDGRRAGISYKEKLAKGMEENLKEKEREMLKTLLVKAGMGGMLK